MVRPRQTLVVYMGRQALRELLAQLAGRGMSPGTPAALVAHGTTPRQEVLRGTVATLAALADAAGVTSPALLIVGNVAGGEAEALRNVAYIAGPGANTAATHAQSI